LLIQLKSTMLIVKSTTTDQAVLLAAFLGL